MTTDSPDIQQATEREWRVATFEELGFAKHEAEVLTDAKTYGDAKSSAGVVQLCETPLHHSKVRRMLEDGWTPAQILQVYS